MDYMLLLLILFILISSLFYNSFVRRKNATDNAFASIDAMLKKRFDLIPNLVATVQNYTNYERGTLEKVVALRSKAISGELSADEKIELDNNFLQASRGLVLLSENYPELRANENYNQLMRALNETEEQLSAARRTYNAAATAYNNAVQQFPNHLLASIYGFTTRPLLEITETERENVNVKQLFNS